MFNKSYFPNRVQFSHQLFIIHNVPPYILYTYQLTPTCNHSMTALIMYPALFLFSLDFT